MVSKILRYNEVKFGLSIIFHLMYVMLNAQIIPPDRLTDWIPGVNVGVPGGIPHRTMIGAAVNADSFGTGLADASKAIGDAIDACPEGMVIYIPEGTYRIDHRIYKTSVGNITIRGAGMGKTILKAMVDNQVIYLGNPDQPRPVSGIPIRGGVNKGSKVIALSGTSSIIVGNLVRIEQDDLPYVISRVAPAVNNRLMSVMFRITEKTDTSVTVTPPVPFDFTLSPSLVQYLNPPLINTGVEDLTIDCNGKAWAGVEMDQAWGCWVKNVEIKNSRSRQMFFCAFVAGEIRQNYTHSVTGGGPNFEGIDFYEDGCFNLIEDNIVYNGGFPGIILGDYKGGCAGNAITYNYCYNVNTGYANMAGMDISVSHGPHNMMNLVEGNIAGGMGSDGYFGSTSHITVARNWFTVTHPTCTYNLIGINAGRWNNYFNIIGNVIGTESFSNNGLYQPEKPFSYSDQVIYKLGYPNMGNNNYSGTWGPQVSPSYIGQSANQPDNSLQELDLNVRNTMIIHGNYDYKNKAVIWDPGINDHCIPKSYIYKTKPGFFGDCPWPPAGPDVEGYVNDIPAKRRFRDIQLGEE